jgi:hypothetical protein
MGLDHFDARGPHPPVPAEDLVRSADTGLVTICQYALQGESTQGLSMTFINPDSLDALLFVKPQISREPRKRPLFCLSRANPGHGDPIDHYWGELQQLLKTKGFAKKLDIVDGEPTFLPTL